MHKVVKPFPYSVDGFTLVDLNAGDERDFGAMAAGLVDAGLIEPVGVLIETAVADTPIEMAIDKPRRGRPRK